MNFFKTGLLLAAMTALFMGVGYLVGGAFGAVIALVVAIAMNGFAFWSSDRLALSAHGAQPVTRDSAPELYAMVEELSRNADLPTPGVYIIETDQPNAFATGRSPENGAVAVTTGLMRALDREELAGVIAHELAHIKNRDTLIMTVAATVAGAISMIANFGLFFGGGNSENRGPLGAVAMIAAVILAPIAASLVQMLISRTREYAADRLGAEICRNPIWLARALQKIAGGGRTREMESAEANPASAHLFIVNPLSGARMDNLFSTHPNTENRIAALEAMAREAGGQGFDRGFDQVGDQVGDQGLDGDAPAQPRAQTWSGGAAATRSEGGDAAGPAVRRGGFWGRGAKDDGRPAVRRTPRVGRRAGATDDGPRGPWGRRR